MLGSRRDVTLNTLIIMSCYDCIKENPEHIEAEDWYHTTSLASKREYITVISSAWDKKETCILYIPANNKCYYICKWVNQVCELPNDYFQILMK